MNTAVDLREGTSLAYKRYALALMTMVFTVNLLDRELMGLLLQPIKEDLQLSDTQLGFLNGIAFGLFYATLGLPIARWADRGNRVTIASLAIGLWGLTVMACLVVTNYVQLVFARMAAAVGEAGCKPPTYSLIGDYFPGAAERTRAMSIYWLAGPLASLTGLIAGGWLNEQYGWRMAFCLIGIPDLVLAIVVKLTLIEPRTRPSTLHSHQSPLPSLGAVLSMLWQQRSSRHLTIGLILLFTMFWGVNPWNAAFLIRSHGIGTAELGVWLGLIYGLNGMMGCLLGGYIANRWFAGNERGQVRMSSAAIAAATPCFVGFLVLPQRHLVLMMLGAWYLVLNCFVAPTYALMQRLVPDEMRATVMAAIMLLYNLIGMGVGPQLVGILSDLFLPVVGSDSLRYSMLIMTFVAFWSAYHFWQVGQTVKEDLPVVEESRRSDATHSGFQGKSAMTVQNPATVVSSFKG